MTIAGKFIKWISGASQWLLGVFKSVDAETKKIIPIAVDIVEGIKSVMDTPQSDMVIAIGESLVGKPAAAIIEQVHQALHKWLPVILLKLEKAEDIVNVENLQEKMQLALNELKFSSDVAKNMFWNDFGGLMITELTTGKVPLQNAKILIEDYYQTYIKKSA